MAKLRTFSKEQIGSKIRFENPWWTSGKVDTYYTKMKKRLYYEMFQPLALERRFKRAVVLMGPRRVGKTVMLFHLIQDLLEQGVDSKCICYLSIENPIYSAMTLEELLHHFLEITNQNLDKEYYLIFDEIQYLKDWERHLKTMVDSYHHIKFIVSGSAAAALKLKSVESGAGRFTDFLLPPLTFHEYIDLKGKTSLVTPTVKEWEGRVKTYYEVEDINTFNQHFIDYINYGGYPEVSLSKEIQQNSSRYIRHDIIDKVLLRDLPSLYGIQDVQELNTLFTVIAYNSGNEFSIEQLAKSSGIAKNTIRKYIQYLEAAFLIKLVYKVDQSAKKFKRVTNFKIYLTNPSLRTALFAPINQEDDFIGNMVETAIFSQWGHHSSFQPYYARWASGEVDIVSLSAAKQKVKWAVEIKWSNRYVKSLQKLQRLTDFCHKNQLDSALVTTLDINQIKEDEGIQYHFTPASVYCYSVGRNVIDKKMQDQQYYS